MLFKATPTDHNVRFPLAPLETEGPKRKELDHRFWVNHTNNYTKKSLSTNDTSHSYQKNMKLFIYLNYFALKQ